MIGLGRRKRENLAVGVAAVAFGLAFVVNNIDPSGSVVAQIVLALVCAAALAVPVASSKRAAAFTAFVALSLVGLLALSTPAQVVGFAGVPIPPEAWTGYYQSLFGYLPMVAAVLGYALMQALRCSSESDECSARASALLVAGWGIYPAFLTGGQVAIVATLRFGLTPPGLATTGVLALAVAVIVAMLLYSTRRTKRARNVAWLLLACELAGMVDQGLGGTYVTPWVGVARSIGAVMIAVAVFREAALGFELGLPTIRRGTTATVVLAGFFIVAQIAQNFLSDEYGLVMGGVVAGALLFAANPIQRAIERDWADRAQATTSAAFPMARGAPAAATASKEEAYRNALRIALRDRVLTEDEEVQLAHLSDELGLTHRRAREIRNEVQREAGARE